MYIEMPFCFKNNFFNNVFFDSILQKNMSLLGCFPRRNNQRKLDS
jgi:hypothetical protein